MSNPIAKPCEDDRANTIHDNRERNSREYLSKKTRLESYPYHIQMGTDNRCNLRCGFCLADAFRLQGKVHIQDRKLERNPLELFEALVPYMKYWQLLSLTGPGESLLNPRLEEILSLVREHSSCYMILTTNGVLINERVARVILDNGIDEVSISLDSLTPEIFEKLRVNAKFEKAVRAIEVLNREKEARGTDKPKIHLTPTFFKMNLHELPHFVPFAKKHRIDSVQVSPGQVYREDWLDESLLHIPDKTRRMAEKAERLAAREGVRFVNNLRMVYLNRGNPLLRFFRGEEQIDYPTDPSSCLKPWSSLYVEPDGEVRPCCYRSPLLGNLFENSFSEIWNGGPARELRRQMLEGHPPELCRNCYEFNRHRPEIMVSIEK